MHVNPRWCHSFCWHLKHGAFVTTGLYITQYASVQPITWRLYLQADGTYGWNDEPLKEQFNTQMEHFVIIYSPSCHFKPVWLENWDFRAVMEGRKINKYCLKLSYFLPQIFHAASENLEYNTHVMWVAFMVSFGAWGLHSYNSLSD